MRKGPPSHRAPSRHVPSEIRRAVYERDGGQCAFVSKDGRRCEERGGLELDHVEGFARLPEHSVAGIRLLCKRHNVFEAERLYGKALMDEKKACPRTVASTGRRTPDQSQPLPPSSERQLALFS